MDRRELLRRLLIGLSVLGVMPDMDRIAEGAAMATRAPAGPEVVAELASVQHELWLRWHLIEPHELSRVLSGFGATLASIADHGARPELERLFAFNSALSGLNANTLGDDGLAAAHLTAAGTSARNVGDRPLAALALLWGSDLASTVQMGMPGPSPAAVLGALHTATVFAAEGPPALRAYVAFRLAEELAAARELEAASRALYAAQEVLEQPHGDGLYGRPWPYRLSQSFAGNVALLLDLPGTAEVILRDVVASLPADGRTADGGVSSDGIATMGDLGAALARQGEVEEACGLLGRAYELAQAGAQMDRVRRIHRIRMRELGGRESVAAVRQLDERAGWDTPS